MTVTDRQTDRPTDKQTDKPCYSVCNNRPQNRSILHSAVVTKIQAAPFYSSPCRLRPNELELAASDIREEGVTIGRIATLMMLLLLTLDP